MQGPVGIKLQSCAVVEKNSSCFERDAGMVVSSCFRAQCFFLKFYQNECNYMELNVTDL